MAKKRVDDAAADGGPKKGKSNLLPAIVVAAGLLGGGYFMSGGGGAKAEPAAAEGGATTTTTEKVEHGEVVKLDSITLNLADGRFVKLGIALELEKGAGGGGGHGGGGAAAAFEGKSAVALDLAISTLGEKTYGQLAAPGGRPCRWQRSVFDRHIRPLRDGFRACPWLRGSGAPRWPGPWTAPSWSGRWPS